MTPPRRAAFTVIELIVTLMIVSTLTAAAVLYLGDEGDEARITRAKAELASLRRRVQAAILKAPGYHVDTLEQALEVDEPPLDPWGRPYLLMHAGLEYPYDPDEAFWTDGTTDALYAAEPAGACSGGMGGTSTHWIISPGPGGAFLDGALQGPEAAALDDLKVMVKLGPPAGSAPGLAPPPPVDGRALRVRRTDITLRIYDPGAIDGERVSVALNGAPVGADLTLGGPPGSPLALALSPGPNTVAVTATGVGSNPPCTFRLAFSDLAGPDTGGAVSLRLGQTLAVAVEAP